MITMWKRRYIPLLGVMTLMLLPALSHSQVRLPEGTEVWVQFAQDVSSKYVKPGEQVPIELMKAIEVGGVTLVKAGAAGTARVKTVESAGGGGKGGKIEVELIGLTADGNYTALEDKSILLTAMPHDGGVFTVEDGVIKAKGKGKGWFPWLFLKLFLKGGQAELQADVPIKAQITESLFVTPTE